MDARTIETRLKEIAGGADMVRMAHIMQYSGTGKDWVRTRLRESGVHCAGTGTQKMYHIHDVAKALST